MQEVPSESILHNFYFTTEFQGLLILHWGVSFKNKDWTAPCSEIFPPNTKLIDKKAVQTKFIKDLEHTSLKSIKIDLKITQENMIKSLNFVFLKLDGDKVSLI